MQTNGTAEEKRDGDRGFERGTTVEGDGFWVKETAAFFSVLARLKIEISILPLFLFLINR